MIFKKIFLIYILLYAYLFLPNSSYADSNMNLTDTQIVQLLANRVKKFCEQEYDGVSHYFPCKSALRILKEENDFSIILKEVDFLKKNDVFKCRFFGRGMSHLSFLFAISKDTKKVYLLYNNVDAVNKIFTIEEVNIKNEEEAALYARRVLYLTRNINIRFLEVYNYFFAKLLYFPIMRAHLPRNIDRFVMKEKSNNKYEGYIWLDSGSGLSRNRIIIENNYFYINKSLFLNFNCREFKCREYSEIRLRPIR